MEALADGFDPASVDRRYLCEAALRLLAALGDEPRFPPDLGEIEALAARTGEGRPTEPMRFAVEPAGELPRYSGEHAVWLSPAPGGCLRLRLESGPGEPRSEQVTLRPDGRLGQFETVAGFGVPESELTPRARADRAAMEQAAAAMEVAAAESEQRIEEEQRRFGVGRLRAVVAAPPQPEGGPVVSFVALYETGLIVYYLVPAPAETEPTREDPWAEPLEEAMFPKSEIGDDLGTAYEIVDLGHVDPNSPLLRASLSFVPAVPDAARRLRVRIGSGEAEIELGRR